MATPDDASRRLRLVDNQQTLADTPAGPDDGLPAKQATSFATLVAAANQSAIQRTLNAMSHEQLRTLAIALATLVNATETTAAEVADVGPDGVCAIAIATAAQAFGTTRDAVLSADRHRAVTDARAVAMTAARRGGLTLPAIAAAFGGRDHTTVMYAQTKVANDPRLEAVCTRIVAQLEEHYAEPIPVPQSEEAAQSGRSTSLQRAALDQTRHDTTRHHDEDGPQATVAAGPSR